MVTGLLLRGLLAGLFAGLVAFGFARVFGEPQIDRAVAFEEQIDQAKGQGAEPELVSRQTQAGLGLFTASLAYGAALGGLLALGFAFAYGRAGNSSPRATAAWLALAGFVLTVLVPALKYPPNPPAIGDPATIGQRTALYFIMIASSLAAGAVAVGLAQRLGERLGAWNAALIAAFAFLCTIGAVGYVLPAVNEVPGEFSAVLLWHFRIVSLGVQAVLWTTLGLTFGVAAEKYLGWDAQRRRAAFGSLLRQAPR
ncbi:MAG TPA: CbtA family protein [Stellaceae bacterium]